MEPTNEPDRRDASRLERSGDRRHGARSGMTEPPRLTDRQQLGLLILLTVVAAMALLG